jgi:hypothetical protein
MCTYHWSEKYEAKLAHSGHFRVHLHSQGWPQLLYKLQSDFEEIYSTVCTSQLNVTAYKFQFINQTQNNLAVALTKACLIMHKLLTHIMCQVN